MVEGFAGFVAWKCCEHDHSCIDYACSQKIEIQVKFSPGCLYLTDDLGNYWPVYILCRLLQIGSIVLLHLTLSIPEDFFAINPLLWKLRRQVDDRIEPVLIDKDNDKSGFPEEIKRTGIEI